MIQAARRFARFLRWNLWKLKKFCKTDIRYLWLLDGESAPSHTLIGNFINQELKGRIPEIFQEINQYIFEKESVDLQHIYIDRTKIIANAVPTRKNAPKKKITARFA